MDPISEADTQLIHVHARTLAAAATTSLGSFNEDDVAEDAVRLFQATRRAIAAANASSAEVLDRAAARIAGVPLP